MVTYYFSSKIHGREKKYGVGKPNYLPQTLHGRFKTKEWNIYTQYSLKEYTGVIKLRYGVPTTFPLKNTGVGKKNEDMGYPRLSLEEYTGVKRIRY